MFKGLLMLALTVAVVVFAYKYSDKLFNKWSTP